MTPDGSMNDGGSVIVASFVAEGGGTDPPPGEERATLWVERFGQGGVHETLVSPEVFSWADAFPLAGITSHGRYQRSFVQGDEVTVIAWTRDPSENPAYNALVLAQATLDGIVTVPPFIVHVPPEKTEYPHTRGLNAFAARENEILAASLIVYDDGAGNCETDRYSVRFNLEGNPLGEPVVIDSTVWCANADGELFSGIASVEWSGTYYGYCDLEQSEEGDTYSFWVLNPEGESLDGPVALFPTVSENDALQRGYHCDVVPLKTNEFAIVFWVPAHVPAPTDLLRVYVAFAELAELE